MSVQAPARSEQPERPQGTSPAERSPRARPLFDPPIVRRAVLDSFLKLNPRTLARNPVIFVVEVVSVMVTIRIVTDVVSGGPIAFDTWIALGLWFTVLFANFAEAMAEGRGKAQAESLRRTRADLVARRLTGAGTEEVIPASELRAGDLVVVSAGELIPGDGEIVEGIASVDESAITGESAPVIRESGGDRSAVTGGTKVLSDWIKVEITAQPGESFIDRMITLVEGAERQKTPNEIALSLLLVKFTIIFLIVIVALQPMAIYAGRRVSDAVLIALFVCLIPTTIGGLLSAIGIAGMDRLVQRNVLAMSGRAVEAAGDVSALLLDKTGTITLGNRQAVAFFPAPGLDKREFAEIAQIASMADETPEGRSIVVLAKKRFGLRERELLETRATFIPFTAQTRMSGVDMDGSQIRKGAVDAIERWSDRPLPPELSREVERIARAGGTPLAVARDRVPVGVIELKDVIKEGLVERFAQLRKMGIKTVMITGDNPLTAAAIAEESGVDDFLSEATPETKMALIKKEQEGGVLVAMTGDGTNDAPALAQADVGVAMNTGTTAAKEAGNMVDLDSNPTKLMDIVEIGKQLLITRGSLTTFSIANDVSKYFAIIPAMFAGTYPALNSLNIMALRTPESAILSAVIFNALIIVLLVPLALRGVRYRPVGAEGLLRRNLLIYGLGGIIAPFVGIKLIDLVLGAVHFA
jgi:K+-transporting ATPase ATPase B chain